MPWLNILLNAFKHLLKAHKLNKVSCVEDINLLVPQLSLEMLFLMSIMVGTTS